jgi:acetoin utilization deacetylase AcuC-like enzyme
LDSLALRAISGSRSAEPSTCSAAAMRPPGHTAMPTRAVGG